MALVATDTSFLFSLFGNDAHTAAAQTWAREVRQPISITVLNRYAFGNVVRFAAFRKVISQRDARTSLAAFETDLQAGFLQLVTVDLTAVVAEAARLSELHALRGGHRSFDILHVASAGTLPATTFLTFDTNQRKLATAARLTARP